MAELTALESLIEMGFPRGRAEKALALTGNQGIEAAMDWLMEHEDDPDVDEPLETPLGHILGREPTSSEQGGLEGSGSAAGEGKPALSEEERQEQTKRYSNNNLTCLRVVFHLSPVHVWSKNLDLSTFPLSWHFLFL
uniref:cDNA FLJ58945, highly similar to UBA/UBX 33.3 kDa protein n=1 Tax=Homo sapiens TaxID=9606 RepID=B4DU88_HUMAN|nr:unnamed protein product [Homo sapiens]